MNFQNKKRTKKEEAPAKKRVNRKPGKTAAVIVAVLVAIFVVLAAAVTILLVYKPSYEDKPPAFLTNDPKNTDSTGNVSIVVTDDQGGDVEIERNQEQINIMIIGKDRWAYNTDVMIIASYDVTNGAISLMQIPRDTYIDIGRGNHKANSLLASFYNEAYKNKEADPQAVALKSLEETFEQVFCITIDYYAMMDLNGFVNIVDALGGVEVDVPFDMKYNDPVQGLKINLKKGLQTLDGDKAEQFFRFRADYVEGDIGRVDAQKIFISACLNKVKNNFNVSTIAAIAEQVMQYVTTDIPLQDLVYYAKKALSVDLSKMTMLTLPGIQGRQFDTSGTWYYIVHRDSAIDAINKYFNSYNFDITTSMFDRNDSLYDETGTYMHSIFLSQHTEEESYTADNTSDIHISKYTYKPAATTTATTTAAAPVTNSAETSQTSASSVPAATTAASSIHTETAEPSATKQTADPTDTFAETTKVPDESGEVMTDEPQPEETTVIEVTEEITEPTESEEPEVTAAPAEPTEE